jgi:hypothetical protein
LTLPLRFFVAQVGTGPVSVSWIVMLRRWIEASRLSSGAQVAGG